MLDRCKLLREIESISSHLFFDASGEISRACLLWERMARDNELVYHVRDAQSHYLPGWRDPLDTAVTLCPSFSPYTVVAVDGSQIYPDRHQGSPCFLINIGLVLLRYGNSGTRVQFQTNPYIFAGDEDPLMQGYAIDYVNCQREAFEFADVLTFIQEQGAATDVPVVVLFDGSLIFWHLESKDHELRKHFLRLYFSFLEKLAEAHILYASYLSLPRSKELVQLMKFAGGRYGDIAPEALDHVLDVHIMQSLLSEYSRSALFEYRAKPIEQYPAAIRPHFCYCNVGAEIARVELPAWIAQDAETTDLIMRIVFDQSVKGRGYPVALAEAHEQAVVKGPDRDFFYHLIRRVATQKNHHPVLSQKSLKKRTIGI